METIDKGTQLVYTIYRGTQLVYPKTFGRGLKMEISELRAITGLSQREFAAYFGIPVGTLRNWEQGIATPPSYVFQMIFASMRRDKMINIETIKFRKMLDELAELSANGIEPFENATYESFHSKIFYDSKKLDEEGYKVVLQACLTLDHHDIISYYDADSFEYNVRVKIDEESFPDESIPYVEVKLLISEDIIIIEDGKWYFA